MQTFKKSLNNPIYGNAELGTIFDVLVQKEDGKFRMDFSWRPQKSLAVAFSDDGTHWGEPIITKKFDLTTGWEDNLNRNGVIHVGDTWHMWYTGQARGYSFIGYATSKDGINFERASDEPVLITERQFEGASVMNPCVLYEGGIFKMWYAAGETFEPNVLAYAESKDGIHWEKSRINPIFVKDRRNEYEQNRVGGCQVLKVDGLGYLMFYIGYKDIHTACICAALSPDGKTQWKRCVKNPLVVPEKDSWDEDSCYKPSAMYDENMGGWRIWYNGRRDHDEYIGEAFMPGDFSPEDFA
jgi:predicted GH43/DUF377 family glycosyl hydrolase